MLIRSRAPVRIDFAGGWTDVALFTEESKGLVANAAINIYFIFDFDGLRTWKAN